MLPCSNFVCVEPRTCSLDLRAFAVLHESHLPIIAEVTWMHREGLNLNLGRPHKKGA